MAITAGRAREAANLLGKFGLPRSNGRALAAAAQESGKTLMETLKLVASLQMQGQGEGPSPEARRVAMAQRRRR